MTCVIKILSNLGKNHFSQSFDYYMYTLTTICILYHVTVSWPSGLMGSNPQMQIQSTSFTKSLYKRHQILYNIHSFILGMVFWNNNVNAKG